MSPKKNSDFESVWLIFLLIFWKHGDAQVNSEELQNHSDDLEAEGGAFYALRSCHQQLGGDSGDFFSPDYLCSNPPLWCNWTIKVDPGKRIHLHLEDLTPDDACHLKQDQIHVDEPAGLLRGHRVLQRCWREARFTSSFNSLYVVLLIGGAPSPPYRGFSGHYQAFGPPVVYNPQDGLTETDTDSQDDPRGVNPDLMYEDYDQQPPWEEDQHTEVGVKQHSAFMNFSHTHPSTAEPTVPTSTQETSRSGRGADLSGSSKPSEPPQENHREQGDELQTTTPAPAPRRRDAEEESTPPGGAAGLEVSEVTDEPPPSFEEPEPELEEPEGTHPHPHMVEQLSDHRGHYNRRNHSENSHLPGDHLFEVAVEVNFQQDFEESTEELSMSLQPVKTLISKKLEGLLSLQSVSFKRIKRLSLGALCILWLQVRPGPEDYNIHRVVKSLHALTTIIISLRGKQERGVVMSVSIADVNECGTQMVMCDLNADCVNEFGSYMCRCRPGFKDVSRFGSGTVCAAAKETGAGCSPGLSSETKGVYVLFFLLSGLILMLLAAAGTLYHRHHRGAFLVRCHSNLSHPDPNNNHHHHEGDPDLTPPPPPPPARGFREGWPQVKERLPPVDLPLLRFSPLLPPEGGKV